jgi:hypothetical protein
MSATHTAAWLLVAAAFGLAAFEIVQYGRRLVRWMVRKEPTDAR